MGIVRYIASCNTLPVNNEIIHSKIFLRDFCFVTKITSWLENMYGQGAQAPQFIFNNLFRSMKISFVARFCFFKSILSRKNWQGGGELLLKNSTMDGYVYLPCYCHGRICIAWGPWHFGDFLKIFLSNIGEDPPKKSYLFRAGAHGTVQHGKPCP